MTAEHVLVRVQPEERPFDEHTHPALTEAELFEGYRARLEMLRPPGEAPASPYKPREAPCPCHGPRGERA